MNFIITTLFIASCIISVANCGDYYRIDGRTYFTSYPATKNWYQAKRFCTLLGTQLVDVPNEAENNRILSVINQTETRYNLELADWWTSGTDLGSEKKFYWDTTGDAFEYTYWKVGEPYTKGEDQGSEGQFYLDTTASGYTNWRIAEPNDEGGEHCVLYYRVENHYWNHRSCTRNKYFICRDPVVVSQC